MLALHFKLCGVVKFLYSLKLQFKGSIWNISVHFTSFRSPTVSETEGPAVKVYDGRDRTQEDEYGSRLN